MDLEERRRESVGVARVKRIGEQVVQEKGERERARHVQLISFPPSLPSLPPSSPPLLPLTLNMNSPSPFLVFSATLFSNALCSLRVE